MRRWRSGLVAALAWGVSALSISACKVEAAPEAAEVVKAEPEPGVERPAPPPEFLSTKRKTPVLTETASSQNAEILAGFVAETDLLAADVAPHLRAYQTRVEGGWAAWENKVGQPTRAWGQATLDPAVGETILYPFSGPDFSTVHRLYPEASRYVLVAMQKAGPPPELESLDREELDEVFNLLSKVFENFTRKGFFITQKMNARFGHEQPVKGLTALLMAFAAREGFLVESIEPIWINRDAKVEMDPGDPGRARTWDSVRLNLIRRSDGDKVTLDYLRLNLADRSILQRPYAMKWLETVAQSHVFVKAASHLMQQSNFAYVRDTVQNKSKTLLQDESGVAYSRLVKTHKVSLFGNFKKVNVLFKEGLQSDLAAAYAADADIPELPFKIGYAKRGGSCLLFARPIASNAQPEPSAGPDSPAVEN